MEALELLHATPTAFATAIRDGGGAREWIWKGIDSTGNAGTEALISGQARSIPDLRYRLDFTAAGQQTEVIDEVLENAAKHRPDERDVFFYYRFQKGNPVINVRGGSGTSTTTRRLGRQGLLPDESVLSQRKDPEVYPELTWVGQQFARIQTFREWSFGRFALVRQPQPADLPANELLSDSRNLGLMLNHLEHSDAGAEFNSLLSRFLPRYRRLSTLIEGGTVQFYLHEQGLKAPIPATRLSDGTHRVGSCVRVPKRHNALPSRTRKVSILAGSLPPRGDLAYW